MNNPSRTSTKFFSPDAEGSTWVALQPTNRQIKYRKDIVRVIAVQFNRLRGKYSCGESVHLPWRKKGEPVIIARLRNPSKGSPPLCKSFPKMPCHRNLFTQWPFICSLQVHLFI